MSIHYYRYRSTKALLGEFEELERQEIYFSSPADLNDPIEGFKDLYWSGDKIVWRNFMKHYILCLMETVASCFFLEAKFDPKSLEDLVFQVPEGLPVAPIQSLYKKACELFLAEPTVDTLIAVMCCRAEPVRRDELRSYLRSVHPFALRIVMEMFAAGGLPIKPPGMPPAEMEKHRRNAISVVEGVNKQIEEAQSKGKFAEAIFVAYESAIKQIDLQAVQ